MNALFIPLILFFLLSTY